MQGSRDRSDTGFAPTILSVPIGVIRGQLFVVDDWEAFSVKIDLIHRELSESILGAAMKVLNTLKPGLDEKLYERAMVIELKKGGHRVEQQRQFSVHYEEEHIGTLIPDLIVDDLVIVDPKVVSTFNDTGMAQMLGYLTITKLRLALLLNFKHAELKWKRVVV
jgi:GxxExxY protein